jgi:predicted HicB family RNase H-like nuclease
MSKTMLKYKGYTGFAIHDDEARIFHGEVAALKAVITFQWCNERTKEPERPHSGKINLRMPPDIYVKVVSSAAQERISMNSYIFKRLSA